MSSKTSSSTSKNNNDQSEFKPEQLLNKFISELLKQYHNYLSSIGNQKISGNVEEFLGKYYPQYSNSLHLSSNDIVVQSPQVMSDNDELCSEINKNGNPCVYLRVKGTKYCKLHNKANENKSKPKKIEDTKDKLESSSDSDSNDKKKKSKKKLNNKEIDAFLGGEDIEKKTSKEDKKDTTVTPIVVPENRLDTKLVIEPFGNYFKVSGTNICVTRIGDQYYLVGNCGVEENGNKIVEKMSSDGKTIIQKQYPYIFIPVGDKEKNILKDFNKDGKFEEKASVDEAVTTASSSDTKSSKNKKKIEVSSSDSSDESDSSDDKKKKSNSKHKSSSSKSHKHKSSKSKSKKKDSSESSSSN